METQTEMDRLKTEVVSLSQEVHRLRGLVKRKNDVLREVAMLVNIGRIAPPLEGGHEWDADGERCVKCGDKDWMASPTCKPAERTGTPCPNKMKVALEAVKAWDVACCLDSLLGSEDGLRFVLPGELRVQIQDALGVAL